MKEPVPSPSTVVARQTAGGRLTQEPGRPGDCPDDVLLFPHPVMGMLYDNFDSVLTDILRSQPEVPAASASCSRPDYRCRGVREFISPQEGRGYSDYFKLSAALCVSVTDFEFVRNTWINLAAGSGLMKVRLLLSGRILSESGAVMGRTSEAVIDISSGSSQTGFYVPANERTRIVCLHCRAPYLTEVMGLRPADLPAPLERFLTRDKTFERLKIAPNAGTLQAARQLAESRTAMAGPLRAPYMESLSTQILLHTCSALARQWPERRESSLPRTRDVKRIATAREHLAQHFVNPPRISELARLVGVNQTKLKAGFRKLTGMSIYQYVVGCRMQRAAHLLATQDYAVAEVAYRVGYAHPTNFTHAFKHYHGMLPRAFALRGQS